MSDSEFQLMRKLDSEGLISFTRDVTKIPSPSGDEKAVAEAFARKMEQLGLEVEIQDLESSSKNVLGRLRGSGGGRSLMFNGHIDIGGATSGWTRDPYSGALEGGKIFGHGVSNMKASDTAFVYAAAALKSAGANLKGDITVALVAGEITGGQGSRFMLRKGVRADMAVVGEPTDMNVATFHSGSVPVKVGVIGREGHFANVDPGANAIEGMIQYLRALGTSHETIRRGGWMTLPARAAYDGLPRFNVGHIKGGLTRKCSSRSSSHTADYCTAILDFRIVPGQSEQSVLRDMRRLAKTVARKGPKCRVEIGRYQARLPVKPLETPMSHPLVRALAESRRKLWKGKPKVGVVVPYSFMFSDGPHLQAAGIPSALFGPGHISASIPDEYVRVDKLIAAAKIYMRTALRICTDN